MIFLMWGLKRKELRLHVKCLVCITEVLGMVFRN